MAASQQEIILYDHPVSSYAQKIRIALREKQVPFKAILPQGVLTGKPDTEFLRANPRLEVPTLIEGDVQIFDSTIILEYIEDKWSSPPLLPTDPIARAKARMIEEVCDTHYEAVNWGWSEIVYFERATGELGEKLKSEVISQTRILQAWLTERLGSNAYFNGNSLGWADICVGPIVNRSRYYGLGPEAGSPLAQWLSRIREHDSVKDTFAEFEAAAPQLIGLKDAFLSGQRKREYRDHRLEWLIKSGGISVVVEGLKNDNVRFSWPDAQS